MTREFKQGDRVEWNTLQGTTRGTVKKKLTSDTEVGGQKINALGKRPVLPRRDGDAAGG